MEPVEYRGYWWPAGAIGEPISGTLTFVPGAPPKLRPIGSFKAPEDAFRSVGEPIIQGVSTNGKPVTLYRCGEATSEISFPGIMTTDYLAKVLLVGHHFERANDIAFPLIEIKTTYLDDWTCRSGFTLKHDPSQSPPVLGVEYQQPQDLTVTVGDFSVTITQSFVAHLGRGPEQRLVKADAIRIAAREAVHLETFLDGPVHLLVNFLAFAIGQPVYATDLRAFLTNPPTDDGISIYYATGNNRRDAPSPYEMLFLLPDVLDTLEDCLRRWFALPETVAPVLDLYFATLYGEATMYQHHQFLSLAQALESYHREVYDGRLLPDDAFKAGRDAFAASLPPDLDPDIKTTALDKLNNEVTLAARLAHLIAEAPRTVVERALPAPEEFASLVRRTRNYFTHYDKKLLKKVPQGVDLLNLVDRMRWLLEGLLLRRLGLPEDRVEVLLQRNERLKRAGTASLLW